MEVEGCVVPDDRLYDLEFEVWWKEEADGSALLGLLQIVGAFAGPFRTFAFRPVEGPLARGRSVATVESVRFTGAVRLPRDAVVIERNPEVERRPRLLNDRPYAEGWVARVRPLTPTGPAFPLEPAAAIRDRLAETIRARRIRCWPQTPEVELVEVGIECSAILVKLREELARRGPGEAVLLVTDDPTSPIEMVRWTEQTGYPLLAQRREGTLYQVLIEKVDDPRPRRPRR